MLPPPALIQAAPPAALATLPAGNLLAEDLAFEAATGRWFVSSVHRREILVKAPGQPWRVFAKGDLPGVLGLALDASRHLLWAACAGLPQAEVLTPEARGHACLVAFDLRSGREMRRVALEGQGHALGDLTLGGDGTVFASDSQGGGVYRLDPGAEALARISPEGVFRSPQTPALTPRGLLVPDYARGVALLPTPGGAPVWLAAPTGVDLRGLDGMALVGRRLYAVQNSGSPTRLLALDLDEAFTKVESVSVLLDVPEATHVLARKGALYLLTGNGWDDFTAGGEAKPGTAAHRPRILRIKLP